MISRDKKDYKSFERVVFIAWPGNPENAADFIEASNKSREIGPIIGRLIQDIKNKAPTMEINIIAHSMGNGVLLKALDYIGENHSTTKIDHAFFWQAAIPSTALSTDPNYKSSEWYSPYAQKAAKKITVLYSQNDNIVGPMLKREAQPSGVIAEKIWHRKPDIELLAGAFTKVLNLGSLYESASLLGVPVSQLLSIEGLDKAWLHWRKNHLDTNADNNGLFYQETLEDQVRLYHQQRLIKQQVKLIKQHLEDNKLELMELLSHLKSSTTKCLAQLGTEAAIHTNSSIGLLGTLAVILSSSVIGVIGIYVGLYKFNKFYEANKSLLDRIISFLLATVFYSPQKIKPQHGMGWFGVDLKDPDIDDLYTKGILNPVNTTRWLWHHSDMKAPSEDIKKHIYKKQIINQKGLKFGHHIGKGDDE